MISIVGIPTDKHSSFLKGASQAPPAIMKEFHSEAGNRFSENGLDLGKNGLWKDVGSLDLTGKDNEFEIMTGSPYPHGTFGEAHPKIKLHRFH